MRADDCARPENAEQASDVAPAKPQLFVSLQTTQETSPDHHYDSTVDNLQSLYRADETDPIWTLEPVRVVLIDPFQVIDDPDDDESHNKVGSIRETMSSGGHIPPSTWFTKPQGSTRTPSSRDATATMRLTAKRSTPLELGSVTPTAGVWA